MSSNPSQQNEPAALPRPQPLKSRSPSRLFRKFTTKLRPTSLHPKSANPTLPSPPKSPKRPSRQPTVPVASSDAAAIKRRRAALQQCGLVPLERKDLSQLEKELDRRFSHLVTLPQDTQEQDEMSSAEKIRREWQAKNEVGAEAHAHGVDSDVVPSDSLNPEPLAELDSVTATEQVELSLLASSGTLLGAMGPISLSPIPETFPDIPEGDAIPMENEQEFPLPETLDPLNVPLPDSPLSSSADLPGLSAVSSPRESKRPPPIVVDTTATEIDPKLSRGRSLNRGSIRSLESKQSLPALSPTMTTSSSSSIPTPRDEESRERMQAVITRSVSQKSYSSRFGRTSGVSRGSEDLGVVHESPELPLTESKTWNPNRESSATMGSAGFEAFVEKRQRRRMSTGMFHSNKRTSGSVRSSRKSAGSELSLMWGAITNVKSRDGPKSRSSTLPVPSVSANENGELAPTQSQAVSERPQSKITRSRSVIASLGFKMTRKASRPALLPSPPLSPIRRPTVKIVENRENLIREVKGIEDDESRRLTELAFMDF